MGFNKPDPSPCETMVSMAAIADCLSVIADRVSTILLGSQCCHFTCNFSVDSSKIVSFKSLMQLLISS